MDILQPKNDVILPEDVKNAIESARNQITILNAEIERLKRIVVSESYSIGQLHNQKSELELNILDLKKAQEKIKSEVDTLQKEKSSVLEDLSNMKSESETLKELDSKRSEETLLKEEALEIAISSFNKEKETFESEKNFHNENVKKILSKHESMRNLLKE